MLAGDRLELAMTHLVENAIVHSTPDDAVVVSVETADPDVRISVRDEGPGLPEPQRRLLESGDIDRYDDPETGFGLNIVRLLVESYRGSIETAVDDTGTTVTVVLPREDPTVPGWQAAHSELSSVRPAGPFLAVTLAAAVVAGVS